MISFLKGTLRETGQDTIVVEVNGVGYELIVHLRSFHQFPALGQTVAVFTHLQVLENELKLYGFLDQEEREMFKKVLTVSGMGAKGALNILGVMEPAEFYRAIVQQDEKSLIRVPGVGKKTAQRLIFELKDKLGQITLAANDMPGTQVGELLDALEALGYKQHEVVHLVTRLEKSRELTDSLESNIKKVLQTIAVQSRR